MGSSDYLHSCCTSHGTDPDNTAFIPKHRPQGSLNEFLSFDGVFFKEVYCAELHISLYDVKWVVEQEIDGWIDRVTKNDDACIQLEILANKYSSAALKTYRSNPELLLVMLLTIIQL